MLHRSCLISRERLASASVLCALALCIIALSACHKSPTRGSFAIFVSALAFNGRVVPKATVLINGARVGQTDDMGVYRGSMRGRVGSMVELRIVGQGNRNQFKVKVRLRTRRDRNVRNGWRFIPIKITARLLAKKTPMIHPQNNRLLIKPLVLNQRKDKKRERLVDAQKKQKEKPPVDVRETMGVAVKTATAVPTSVRKTRCFQGHRGPLRVVQLIGPSKSILSLIGDCIERIGVFGGSGKISLALPVGHFVRFQISFSVRKSVKKVVEVTQGKSPLVLHFQQSSRRCDLTLIRRKLINRIALEREEYLCLQKVSVKNPHYFSAWLYLARGYCNRKRWKEGREALQRIFRDPRHRYHPYRALQMGMEFGRCRFFSRAIRMLKRASQQIHRMAVVDRYKNTKAIHGALFSLYERRFYKRKRPSDLNQALQHAKRLAEHTMSREPASCRKALQEVKRLKRLVSRHGALDE